MIQQALLLLRDELEAYLHRSGDISAEVVLENIALLESPNNGINVERKITITCVNIEEESSLKNTLHFKKNLSGGIDYEEPPVFLNLYILFCANYPGNGSDNYFHALQRISSVIRFFQSKSLFTLANSPNASISNNLGSPDPVPPEVAAMRLSMELYTLTFEQINHLWGSLGGKQVPFAMYKCRLVEIMEPSVQGGSVIREVHNDYIHTT